MKLRSRRREGTGCNTCPEYQQLRPSPRIGNLLVQLLAVPSVNASGGSGPVIPTTLIPSAFEFLTLIFAPSNIPEHTHSPAPSPPTKPQQQPQESKKVAPYFLSQLSSKCRYCPPSPGLLRYLIPPHPAHVIPSPPPSVTTILMYISLSYRSPFI